MKTLERSRPSVVDAPDRLRRPATVGVGAMVLAAVSWGFGTAVAKLSLERTHLRPMTQQVMQLGGSIVVLVLVASLRRRAPSRPTWRQGWIGVLEPGASYVLGLIGLSMTAASHASVIGALEPSFVVLGAWLLLRHRIAPGTAVLMGCSLLGAVVVVTSTGAGDGARASSAGDGLLVLGVACAGAYVLLSSRKLLAADPLTATLVQQLWALGIVVPAFAASVLTGGVGPLPRGGGWLLVLVAGLLGYLVPFALYLTALRSLAPAMAAQYLALIPLAGLLGAATLLGERVTPTAVVGGAVVVVSLVLLARVARHEP